MSGYFILCTNSLPDNQPKQVQVVGVPELGDVLGGERGNHRSSAAYFCSCCLPSSGDFPLVPRQTFDVENC